MRTPEQVHLFPKAGPRNPNRSNNRRKMKSAILTSTQQKNRAHAGRGEDRQENRPQRETSSEKITRCLQGKSGRILCGVWRFFQVSFRGRMGQMYILPKVGPLRIHRCLEKLRVRAVQGQQLNKLLNHVHRFNN